MTSYLFCLSLSVDKADTKLIDFLKHLREDLNVVYDELHSEDEQDWLLFFQADDQLLNNIQAEIKLKLTSVRYIKHYILAQPNSCSFKRSGDKPVILNPMYGLVARIDF